MKNLFENWGKHWPIDFPHLNVTPKGHDLVRVLPEILKHTQSFYMFYKVEEKGESIHDELNSIQQSDYGNTLSAMSLKIALIQIL